MDTGRRDFLKRTIYGAAGLYALSNISGCLGNNKSPSDIVRLGFIGTGARGKELIKQFMKLNDCRIDMICDADTGRMNRISKMLVKADFKKPKKVKDLRHVLDNKEIDAVVIATPNHWHALSGVWALQAGKHVFLEKPVTHTLKEGSVLLAAAATYDRVIQSGTHRRSNTVMAEAVEYIRSGRIGDVRLARCIAYRKRNGIGAAGSFSPPKSVDYDLWTGPAPLMPVTRSSFHYHWHWFWEYGDGTMGNNGVHRVDLARWALGLKGLGDKIISYGGRFGFNDAGHTPNTQVTIHQFDDVTVVQEIRELQSDPFQDCGAGAIFYGTEGRVVIEGTGAYLADDKGLKIRDFAADTGNHFSNFVSAVKANDSKMLNGSLEEGVWSSALCHTANIAHRVGNTATDKEVLDALAAFGGNDALAETFSRTRDHLTRHNIKASFTLSPALTLDTRSLSILGDTRANDLASCSYRAPFTLPSPANF